MLSLESFSSCRKSPIMGEMLPSQHSLPYLVSCSEPLDSHPQNPGPLTPLLAPAA